jgi:nicotinamidase-related amidase
LAITGIVKDACITFVDLSTNESGFDVFVLIDASCTFTNPIRGAAWM